MAADPMQCRKHAMACLRLPQTARTSELRASLLSMAQTWAKLAVEAERYEALLAEQWMEEPAPAADESELIFHCG